jgi:hypothetical protein
MAVREGTVTEHGSHRTCKAGEASETPLPSKLFSNTLLAAMPANPPHVMSTDDAEPQPLQASLLDCTNMPHAATLIARSLLHSMTQQVTSSSSSTITQHGSQTNDSSITSSTSITAWPQLAAGTLFAGSSMASTVTQHEASKNSRVTQSISITSHQRLTLLLAPCLQAAA